jgi:DNA repair protein RadC
MSMTHYPRVIKEWPEDERPRERLMKLGADALSEAQLLAIVLATGEASSGQSALDLAMHLVHTFGGLRALDAASITELCQTKGIGPAKATTIKAALELGKRLSGEPAQRNLKVTCPQDLVNYFQPRLLHLRKEVQRRREEERRRPRWYRRANISRLRRPLRISSTAAY